MPAQPGQFKPDVIAIRERMRTSKSVAEVLRSAIEFEKKAHDFYSSLKGQVSGDLKELVAELATEEKRHWLQFETLAARWDVQSHLGECIAPPEEDARYESFMRSEPLGDMPSECEILSYAISREYTAMTQYRALSDEALPGPMRDVFRFLANEEWQHMEALKNQYEIAGCS